MANGFLNVTDTDPQVIARSAARTAGPFVEHLSGRYRAVVEGLRTGRDAEALTSLGNLADELEHFLRFLVLIHDFVESADPRASANVLDYRSRLLGVVESIEPALSEIDLVEVADALEDDLIPTLAAYRDFDDAVMHAVGA